MKKLSQKAETFQILRNSGKSRQEAYKLAGYQGDASGSAPYKLEGNVRKHTLCDPQLLKIGKNVAKHVLEIALETLKTRKDDPALQMQCLKETMKMISDMQDRIEPKKNVNFNTNANVDIGKLDLNQAMEELRLYRTNNKNQG